MFKAIVAGFVVVASLIVVGCDNLSGYSPTSPSLSSSAGNLNEVSRIKEVAMDVVSGLGEPARINGVELRTTRGWHGNTYPWNYDPAVSGVHPVSRLWTPNQTPSPFQVMEQCRQIKEFGGGAIVLEYSPNPALPWHNYWLSVDFGGNCGLPFYLLYEEINGTRFIPPDGNGGPKNMSLEHNRRVFKEDIDFMFKNVIVPNQSRYVTVDGRAVIYMWATSVMVGDFASLLEEVKAEYPVFFIGDEGVMSVPKKEESINRIKALDGFMIYSLGGNSNYLRTVQDYRQGSFEWRQFLRTLELETGKRRLLIPTFQAAYDDSNYPGRTAPLFYPRSREEIKYHAELIRSGMGSVYDYSIGPFVVYSELPEGAAVIESQCLPKTLDTPNRFVGCGTARLQILKEYFGWR